MRRRIPLAALAAALAGCPLPQPLPDYPAGTITPPRILADGVDDHARAVRLVPAGCAVRPEYPLTAQLYDTNNIETVEARWFVNYEASETSYSKTEQVDAIPPDPDPLVLVRIVPPRDELTGEERPFLFRPYDHPPPYGMPLAEGPPYSQEGILRVVELVVSNGFDPDATSWPASPLPHRATLPGFETQVYRWVFVTVPPSAAVPCPPG